MRRIIGRHHSAIRVLTGEKAMPVVGRRMADRPARAMKLVRIGGEMRVNRVQSAVSDQHSAGSLKQFFTDR
jgi:hypothetical protein